jgi:hypothetical protein
MASFRKSVFWSAVICMAALFALIVWWNGGGEKDQGGSSAARKKQNAAASAPQKESRSTLGEWISSWGFLAREQGSQTEKLPGGEFNEIEDSVRKTFLAYNRQDLPAFKAGWTDQGFQRAYELPKERAKHFGLLGLLSFRPYAIGEFSNTAIYGKSAETEVVLTYGEIQESHRMSLVWDEDAWKIDQDEKLDRVPKNATVVDVKLQYYKIQLDPTRAAPGTVAFRITNTDSRQHEFVVKRWNPASDTEDNIGLIKPLEPGQNETLVLANLQPGRYIVLCNMVARDGMPYSYGMRNVFIIQ